MLMMTNYGSLANSLTTTTRKFFTILASVFIFGHVLLARQWVGTVLVFMGLGLGAVYGRELKADTNPSVREERIKQEERRKKRHD